MISEAQKSGTPFYADLKNQACPPSSYVLGYDLPKIIESGYLGVALQAFKEAYANRRIYEVVPRFKKDTVNYIAFSPLDKPTFPPDD